MILIGSFLPSDFTMMPPASFWACSQPSQSFPCMPPIELTGPVTAAVAPILIASWARAGPARMPARSATAMLVTMNMGASS